MAKTKQKMFTFPEIVIKVCNNGVVAVVLFMLCNNGYSKYCANVILRKNPAIALLKTLQKKSPRPF